MAKKIPKTNKDSGSPTGKNISELKKIFPNAFSNDNTCPSCEKGNLELVDDESGEMSCPKCGFVETVEERKIRG